MKEEIILAVLNSLLPRSLAYEAESRYEITVEQIQA